MTGSRIQGQIPLTNIALSTDAPHLFTPLIEKGTLTGFSVSVLIKAGQISTRTATLAFYGSAFSKEKLLEDDFYHTDKISGDLLAGSGDKSQAGIANTDVILNTVSKGNQFYPCVWGVITFNSPTVAITQYTGGIELHFFAAAY